MVSSVIAASAHAYGNDSVWIVSGATSASMAFQTISTGSTQTIGAAIGVGHSLGSALELLALMSYQSISIPGSATTSTFQILGQLDYAIGDHADAFYFGPQVGTNIVNSGGSSASGLLYGGVVGKRFALGGPVSYDPNVSVLVVSANGTTSNPLINIVPLQFTFVF